jgi:hypothetical protein
MAKWVSFWRMLKKSFLMAVAAPLTLMGPAAGTVFLPGQSINLSWSGGQRMDRVSINATYDRNGETVTETIANVQNLGYWQWRLPVQFQSRAVSLAITETDLILPGDVAVTETFTVGTFAEVPAEEEPEATLRPGLVVTEEELYYYVTPAGTARPIATWEIADTYNRATATPVTRAQLAALPLGRSMLPALGHYVQFASMNGVWRVDVVNGAERLTKVNRVPADTKIFPLPSTMAWALRQ